MKLEKAIEILEHDYQAHHDVQDPIPTIAIRLGIEALKARKVWQDNEGFDPDEALPGETEEDPSGSRAGS